MSVDADLVRAARTGLAEIAEPAKAAQMQAYMKSPMPFRGVSAVPGRALYRRLIATHPLGSADDWQDTIRELFDHASFREERYAALAIARHRRYAPFRTPDALGLTSRLIQIGAWWDLVDETSHIVGDILRTHRGQAEPVIRAWTVDPNLWLRRSSIICQLGHRTDTDIRLLTDAIEPSIHDTEFFLRKAIGWALRDYSKTDEVFVRRYVAEHPALSGLSRREALKWLTAREARASR